MLLVETANATSGILTLYALSTIIKAAPPHKVMHFDGRHADPVVADH